jgi:hypothetical protein
MLLEPLDDVIIPVASARTSMCQPVDMQRRCPVLLSDGAIERTVLRKEVKPDY